MTILLRGPPLTRPQHAVTLWLIGWSYNVHLTYIGVSIFVTMDFSDVFLAVSFLQVCRDILTVVFSSQNASTMSMRRHRSRSSRSSSSSGRECNRKRTSADLLRYFRHYLNLKILWSVLTEFELIGWGVLYQQCRRIADDSAVTRSQWSSGPLKTCGWHHGGSSWSICCQTFELRWF